MKKTIIVLTLLCIFNCSFAQVRLGLKAGGNLANIDGFDKSKMKLGLHAGPVLQVNLAKLLFIQSEFLYSVKGSRSDSTQTSSSATLNLNYITLPVLFGFRPSPNLSVKLGPEIGRLLSAKSEEDGSSRDLSSFYNDFDLGADLALAYTFKKISLDLRYNYGLKELLRGAQNGNIMNEESFGSNRVLQFSLCYFLK
jgi:hypothetical protein